MRSVNASQGCRLDAEPQWLRIAHIGLVKVLLYRPLEGTPTTATIGRSSTGKSYVCFACASRVLRVCFACDCAEPAPLPATRQQVGIDVGLTTFATPSDGQQIAHARFFRLEETALAKAQRRLATAEQGTPERVKRRRVESIR